jgi:hypothetical protein
MTNTAFAIANKMTHGVTQTISDIGTAAKTLIENPKLISEINGETVSREVIETGSKLYEYFE